MQDIHGEIARQRLADLIEDASTPVTRRLLWAWTGRSRRPVRRVRRW
jgi:hypothetical protein